MPLLLPATSNSKLKLQVNKIGHRKTTTTHKRKKSSEATQNKITQFKPKSNLGYGKIFGNNDNQQSSKRANLNGPSTSQNFNVNQTSSTPKCWFEQLQLLPVSFIKEDKVFDTYALIDPRQSVYVFIRCCFWLPGTPTRISIFNYCSISKRWLRNAPIKNKATNNSLPLQSVWWKVPNIESLQHPYINWTLMQPMSLS